MKKAENIIELYRNLNPFKPLDPHMDKDQFINFYKNIIDDLRFQIIMGDIPQQTLYVTGQTGTGKTTALLFLPDETIEQDFETINLMADELFDLNDIDIIDILLRLSFELIEDHPKLQQTYTEELEKIKKKVEGRYEETLENSAANKQNVGGSVGFGNGDGWKLGLHQMLSMIGVNVDFKASLERDKSVRKVTREIFTFNKEDLKGMVNKIIHELEEIIAPKKVLLVFHNLERLQDANQINSLFVDNRQFLEQINCRKLISGPVILTTNPKFMGETHVFSIKLDHYPEDKDLISKQTIDQNKANLKKVIESRIAEGANLIEPDAIELAIKLSGGIIRQFIYIVRNAAKRVAMYNKEGAISVNDIREGANQYAKNVLVSFKITLDEQIAILRSVAKSPHPDVTEDHQDTLLQLILGNQIIVRQNDRAWYVLNPLVAKAIELDD
ncbi:MAG: hypothetical protein AAGG68_20170 [Bacteroidota bacterium]